MKVSQTLADKRRIERNIRGRGLIFRRLFRRVAIAQESRVLQGIPSIAKPTLSNVMDREHENRIIALAMRPFYITTLTDSASEIFEEFPEPEPVFEKAINPMDALDAEIFRYADRYSIAMAKYVNKTTAKKIKKIVQEGLKERLHYSEIVKRVKTDIFKDLSQGVRAKRLAHTEAHGMVENGRSKAARANKVVKEKTWSSAADARKTHGDANGQTVLKNDTFIVGGYQMQYPGDTSYGAGLEEIINCRCSALYSATIHKSRLTTSKDLLARYEEQRMRLRPKDALRISNKNLEELRAERERYGKLLDVSSQIESAPGTKHRISLELSKKLQKNKDFTEYIERSFTKPTDPGMMDLWNQMVNRERKNVVDGLIRQWAGTSGDTNLRAIAMQMAAEEEFGLASTTLGHFSKEVLAKARMTLKFNGKAYKAFLRAQYDLTQEYFKKNGITSITGYRGMKYDDVVSGFEWTKDIEMTQAQLQLQPLSSFSANPRTAYNFAEGKRLQMIIQSDIPVNRVLSTCQTGFGCKSEAEFVALGGKEQFEIMTYEKRYLKDPLWTKDILQYFVGFEG